MSSTRLFDVVVFLAIWSCLVGVSQARLKDVFFHYMIGTTTADHAYIDVSQAQALGVDAFVLNVGSATEAWAIEAVAALFIAAESLGFKLFFSFDMTWFTDPSQFMPMLLQYIENDAYYMHNGLRVVSTFSGGALSFGESSPTQGWDIHYTQVLAAAGHQTYFIPAFLDAPNGASDFFSTYPVVQGAMNWDSWPFEADGQVPVYTTVDLQYQSGARAAGKTFMMGLSPLQFKHMDSWNNWYRSGTHNLADRIPQVLSVSPDFLEIQTWNDAGESHYFGNIWPESMPDLTIPAYTSAYNHSGWQELLPTLISAYKVGMTSNSSLLPSNGQAVQGAFWHHTMLQASTCDVDPVGKPGGIDNVQDVVTVALYAAANTTLTIEIWSGGSLLATEPVTTGYNTWTVAGMKLGQQMVQILGVNGTVIAKATGPLDVVSDSPLWNYNYQVAALTLVTPNPS